MPRRERRRVAAVEAVGPYSLLRLERGSLEPGVPGQFFMLEAPGRILPRPMSLCLAPPGELAFLVDPTGPGTRALCSLATGDEIAVLGPLGNGFRLDVERPLLVGGGIGMAPLPYLSAALGHPPALLGFRTAWHAEAARLLPSAEVVIEPTLVTELLSSDPGDVLACGPEPMLVALRRLVPEAQLAWEAPMACGYGACHGCAVEIDGELRRLCVEGPVLGGVPPPARRVPAPTQSRAAAEELPLLLNASGCLDALTAPEVARSLDAYVTKTVTPLRREGNSPVRIAETAAGLLNSIGLANPGIAAFREHVLPELVCLGVPIWVSVGGFGAGEYAASCRLLDEDDEVAAIELNLSCPNVDAAPESAAQIVGACRGATTKPLWAKLSAASPDIGAAAQAVEAAGADGLSLVNTLRGLALDERTLRPRLGSGAGGLSGPALKHVALAAVDACARASSLPIVGMGGVRSGRDALELLVAGATAVALGTVLFADPQAPKRVREELEGETSLLQIPTVRGPEALTRA